LLLAHVPGGQLQLPHFPVSSDPETVILSLFPLAQVPAGHEQLPHFPVSPATVKLMSGEPASENEFSHVQVALHPHLAQQLQLPQDMMADDDEEEEEEEEDFETQEKTKAVCKGRSAVEEWREKWDGDYKCCNAMVLQ
jgi:hypothetical protein